MLSSVPHASSANYSEKVSLSTSILVPGTISDFDVFLNVGGLSVLYGPSPYRWSKIEIQRLLNEGHQRVYYGKDDISKVKTYVSVNAINAVDKDLPPVHRIGQIADISAEFCRVIFNQNLTSTAVNRAVEIAKSLQECVIEDVNCTRSLLALAQNNPDMYFHSGRVAAYAVAIALQNGETNSHRLTEIALGCLLHDIGNNKLSPEIMHKPAMLSASEWSEVHKHPEFGHQQILHAVLTTIPREIVLHHHERLDGTGYPHGLSRDQILPEVSIAALADIFDSLISDRPYRPARKPYQALELIKCTMVDSVDQDAFKSLVSVFATDFKNSKS